MESFFLLKEFMGYYSVILAHNNYSNVIVM